MNEIAIEVSYNMNWIWLSLISAVSVAANNIITRRLSFVTDKSVILYAKYVFASVFMVVLVCLSGLPDIKAGFYFSVGLASVLEVIANWYFIQAIASDQLSKTFPLVALTPIFLIVTSFFVLGELPSLMGGVGIITIVCGAYMLRLENANVGILEPFKCLLRDPASRSMVIAALLFSVIAVFFKKAIASSSPFFSLCVAHLLGVLLLSGVLVRKKRFRVAYGKMREHFGLLLFNAIVAILAGWTLFVAFKSGFASYVVSIRRTSILFTILLGYLFFKEDHVAKSMAIGLIMVLGIFLISIS